MGPELGGAGKNTRPEEKVFGRSVRSAPIRRGYAVECRDGSHECGYYEPLPTDSANLCSGGTFIRASEG